MCLFLQFNDQFWFFAVPQFWLFLSLLYMYLRCFQVILGKNTHGPRLAAILKFRKFHKGKRPKISKIDKFQWSFVAKGCVVEKSLKIKSLQNCISYNFYEVTFCFKMPPFATNDQFLRDYSEKCLKLILNIFSSQEKFKIFFRSSSLRL